jgi:hypothetical protein
MAAGNTYVAIATQTLSSTATSVTFSSIPSTYTDLVVVCNPIESGTNNQVWAQVNGDTATNYSTTVIYGTGSAANSSRYSSANWVYAFLTSDTGNKNAIIQFMNYSNTTTYKTVLVRSNSTTSYVQASVSLWRSTSAITSILLSAQGTFPIGSTFSLYGIAAA